MLEFDKLCRLAATGTAFAPLGGSTSCNTPEFTLASGESIDAVHSGIACRVSFFFGATLGSATGSHLLQFSASVVRSNANSASIPGVTHAAYKSTTKLALGCLSDQLVVATHNTLYLLNVDAGTTVSVASQAPLSAGFGTAMPSIATIGASATFINAGGTPKTFIVVGLPRAGGAP